jgi:16S rRNA (cytosine967-C5)-methyltransferase
MTSEAPSASDRSARSLARRVLDRVAQKDAWATLTLDGELARSGLPERDRRLSSELVYGVLRHRARLDRALAAHADLRRTPPKLLTVLRVAAYQLLLLDRVPAYAAVDDAVGAARDVGGGKLAGFANAVLRKLVAAGEPPLPADEHARLELQASLPSWIIDELAAALDQPDELAAAALSLAEQAPMFLRGNAAKISRDELIARLAAEGTTATPVDGAATYAVQAQKLGEPGQSESFRQGLYTVQDLSAQGVALAAAAPFLAPSDPPEQPAPLRILDACAGVGGKSTHLAELFGDRATIDAVDLSATKLGLLREAARRLGHASIRTHVCDLLSPALLSSVGRDYPLVILDAPCSGLGVLRRHPDAKWRLAPGDVAEVAALQRRLLDAVVAAVAPGGTLVYSVCTFTAREGKDQVRALLARHPQLTLDEEQQLWPHREGGDGFYLARLTRELPAA